MMLVGTLYQAGAKALKAVLESAHAWAGVMTEKEWQGDTTPRQDRACITPKWCNRPTATEVRKVGNERKCAGKLLSGLLAVRRLHYGSAFDGDRRNRRTI